MSVVHDTCVYSPTAWTLEEDESSEETLSAFPTASMETTCCIRDQKMKSIGISGTINYSFADSLNSVTQTQLLRISLTGLGPKHFFYQYQEKISNSEKNIHLQNSFASKSSIKPFWRDALTFLTYKQKLLRSSDFNAHICKFINCDDIIQTDRQTNLQTKHERCFEIRKPGGYMLEENMPRETTYFPHRHNRRADRD